MQRQVPRAALLLLLGLLCGACGDEALAPQPASEPQAPEPYLTRRDHDVEYAGPGREAPEAASGGETAVAWFAPSEGGPWRAAQLAIEDAGAGGVSLRLVPVWSDQPWGTGIAALTKAIYTHDVLAVTGAPDGPAAHLVEQVVSKTRLPFVSAISTDPSTHLVNVPWIFSLAPGDHIWAPVLAGDIASHVGEGSLVVVSSTHHDARVAEEAVRTALAAHRITPSMRITFAPGQADLQTQVRVVKESAARAAVVHADATDSARVVKALRAAGVVVPIFGGPALGRHAFRQTAGSSGDGVRFPLLWEGPDFNKEAHVFARRFRARHGREADYADAFTYDALKLLAEARRTAGTNRALIRDALEALSPWEGASGIVTWDKTGQNTRSVGLGTWRDGAITGIGGTR